LVGGALVLSIDLIKDEKIDWSKVKIFSHPETEEDYQAIRDWYIDYGSVFYEYKRSTD
jgi:hypothetical protein